MISHVKMQNDSKLKDQVEAYLDGDLSDEERSKFELLLSSDTVLQEEFRSASLIKGTLHGISEPQCPPDLKTRILARVRHERSLEVQRASLQWLNDLKANMWQPALAITIVFALVAGSALLNREKNLSIHDFEVQRAVQEARWTIAYLSKIGRNTGETLRDDVIEKQVVFPMQDAVDTALNKEFENGK